MKKPKSYATLTQQMAICERLGKLLTVNSEIVELRAALIKLSGEFTAAGIHHARELGLVQGRSAEIVDVHNRLVEYLAVTRTIKNTRDYKIQKLRASPELPLPQAAE